MSNRINKSSKRLIMLSPFVVIAIGHLTIQVTGIWLGVWAWVPFILVFWAILSLLIVRYGGREAIKRWLSRSRGSWIWRLLAVAVGLIPLLIFLQNWHLLSPLWVWLPWLLFGLINPWFEEGYWRGLLLDAAEDFPAWAGVLYSSVMFAVSHPLMLGVYSIAHREPALLISTFVMGVCWAIIYRRTGSIRWTIFSHTLVDLLALSVAVFLNLYVPGK
jgi:hypothetical protein